MEWLAHSHKKHCELCKTPFRFTKLYDANMPQTLPWRVFVRTALLHTGLTLVRTCRALLVGMVWMMALPWLVRWAWRWMFWIADAGWAREAFMHRMRSISSASQPTTLSNHTTAFQQFFDAGSWLNTTLTEPMALSFVKNAFTRLNLSNVLPSSAAGTSPTSPPSTMSWPQADDSILSSWTYLSDLTPDPAFNRVLLDIFEGQLITCVVITGFILVFLIREWVVQQQPLINLDNLNNLNLVQQRRQAAAARLQEERDLLVHQQELVERARQLNAELHANVDAMEQAMINRYQGWDHLATSFDRANNHLKNGKQTEFLKSVTEVAHQIRGATETGIDWNQINDLMNDKLASYSTQERQDWEAVLSSDLARSARSPATSNLSSQQTRGESEASASRPQLPARLLSSQEMQGLIDEMQEIGSQAASLAIPDTSEVNSTQADHTDPVNPTASVNTTIRQGPDDQRVSALAPEWDIDEDSESPITNAGMDAKVNIKRRTMFRIKPLSAPEDVDSQRLSDGELKRGKDSGDAVQTWDKEQNVKDIGQLAAELDVRPDAEPSPIDNAHGHDEAHRLSVTAISPDPVEIGAARQESPLHNQEAEQLYGDDAEVVEAIESGDSDSDDQSQLHPAAVPLTSMQRLTEWFWGDIQPQQILEAVVPPHEERVAADDPENDAPLDAFEPGRPAVDAVAAPEGMPNHPRDPEVLAAAAQAGLDADALEDAEDLEGILELLGLQGPLIGLIQTSTFCTVLVVGTVFGAVGLPYIWGKLVLSFLGSPVYFILQMPLQVSSFIADSVIDLALLVGGWTIIFTALAGDFLLSALEAWLPRLGGTKVMDRVIDFADKAVASSVSRLQDAFVTTEAPGALGWSWAFLGASVHAHASLKNIGREVDAVLGFVGASITTIVETISSGSVFVAWQRMLGASLHIPEIPARLLAGVHVQQYAEPVLNLLSGLRSGALTFSISESSLDPSLVYWSSTDRSLAVMMGYLALAALATVYVALDTPITRSRSGQKTEKMIRDTLRQAGGVFKVILIISIEMLIFPFYCGVLLDIAFLPLFQDASVATRWAFATRSPSLFSFMHWFLGTCYMFHFALFVGMCRKILRKGVLWFIRDPDDPTFHPVRDVLERNVATQLRKIAFSALVYGALVILCLGGVIWTIGRLFSGIFPIHWVSTEPVLEFPADLLLYNAITPFMVRFFQPSEAVNTLYGWWFRRCARVLRLSHFLFDDRRKDEEGRHVRHSWTSLLLMREGEIDKQIVPIVSPTDSLQTDVVFRRDGKYVLTPCNDQYRPPKPGEAYLHLGTDSEGKAGEVYIGDKEGKKLDHFAKVYIPPRFRLRVTIFMVCLWMFSVFMGLGGTLVPLVVGRHLLTMFFVTTKASQMNDIYAYSLGAYVLAGLLAVIFQGRSVLQKVKQRASTIDLTGFVRCITEPIGRYALQALKCAYVYGFVGVVLPTLFALCLQFYLILPLHTYIVAANLVPAVATLHPVSGHLTRHTVHILQDYCLGLLYVRIFARLFATSGPHPSRLAEAKRLIFSASGYLNPSSRLATRYFILPTILLFALLLLGPPGVAALIPATWLGIDSTTLYRYSYPVATLAGVGIIGIRKVVRLTTTWRARIRDEVYLVGERLHNFGEKMPPVGSRSVVRRER